MKSFYFSISILFFSFQTFFTIAIAQPSNDDCDMPTSLTVNTDLNCTSFGSGTVLDATASAVPDVCPGDFGDDVWFSFVSTNTTHIITIQNIMGSTTNLNHEVFSGTCSNLIRVYCSEANSSVASDLTLNKIYYVRVATETATPGQNTTFDICITTPPPIPNNDDCEGAIALTMNSDLLCGNTTAGKVGGATTSSTATSCSSFGTFDDDVWFSFQATQTAHQISLLNISGSTTDLAFEIFGGSSDCSSLFSIACGNMDVISIGGLLVGQTYFVRVATQTATAGQNTTFDVCVGEFPPPPSNDDCSGATALEHTSSCNPTTGNIGSATDSGQAASTCGGSPNDDIWYSFVAGAPNPNIEVNAVFDGIAELFDGSCGALTALDCIDLTATTILSPTNLVIGNTYLVRIYAFSAFTPTGINAQFDICVYGGTPPNDDCANAIDILNDVLMENTIDGSTIGANDTDAPVDNCGSMNITGRGVWYAFTYNEAEPALLTFTGSTGLRIFAYTGTCGNLTCVPAADSDGQGTENCQITVDNGTTLLPTSYYIYVSSNSASIFSLSVRSDAVLPIEWTSFSASAKEDKNVLQWSTAAETPFSHFSVERSSDGLKDWTSIGTVPSLEQNNANHNYQFIDYRPLNLAYYRLKIKEHTGQESFSKTVSVRRTHDSAVHIYPNPVQNTLWIEQQSEQAAPILIKILNARGQLISQYDLDMEVGFNKTSIDIEDLESGVYFIKWTNEKHQVLRKIAKF